MKKLQYLAQFFESRFLTNLTKLTNSFYLQYNIQEITRTTKKNDSGSHPNLSRIAPIDIKRPK